jgi:hypothetical protein
LLADGMGRRFYAIAVERRGLEVEPIDSRVTGAATPTTRGRRRPATRG